jgi:anti-sigma B factor antagonist
METFRIRAVPGDTTCTLYLSGEADLAVADDIANLGTVSLDEPTTLTLILDLGGCTFLDSSAIGSLIHLRNTAIAAGKRVVLMNVSARIRRILTVTGLDAVFDVSAPEDSAPCAIG